MVNYDENHWDGLALELENTVDVACKQLGNIPDETTEARSYPGAWSVKEIVGHLIDSATNNHQRFVRLQVSDGLLFPDYSQDNDAWVSIQEYQQTSWNDLLSLWQHFNNHLARVIRSVNQQCLGHKWVMEEETSVTLAELMDDYPRHLNDHLQQIRERIDP